MIIVWVKGESEVQIRFSLNPLLNLEINFETSDILKYYKNQWVAHDYV